jgi:phenylacetate-CoA ligase
MAIQIMLKLMNHLRKLRQHERWTRAQLEAYQAEVFRRQREYAYAHSPFYQRFHKGLTERPLGELPVLTEAMVMENFYELATDPAIRLEELRAHMADESKLPGAIHRSMPMGRLNVVV